MDKHYKYFIFFSIFISIVFLGKLYHENETAKEIKRLSIMYEAESIADFMIAFRTTYQNIFIQNHTKLDESNIDFLPVKTTNEIARVFSSLNTKSKIATVSDRPRNIVNMANARQMEAIDFFKKNTNKTSYFKSIGDTFYYSQPLYITKTCLKCHGKRENAPSIISNNYDNAYNYKLGELRGILDIEVSQTNLSLLLDNNNSDRILFIGIFLTIILGAIFIYTRYNIRLDKQIKLNEEIEKLKDEERHQTELKQKNYLDTIIESNNNAIIAIDHTATILTYNKKAEEIFGFTKEEMIGSRNLTNIIPPKYKDLHIAASTSYFKSGKSKGILNSTLELEGLTKEQKIIPIRISFGTNTDKHNKIVIANISDISEEKMLLHNSKLAQDKLKKSIVLFGDNVIASNTDLKGVITYASSALCRISGYQENELIGKPHNVLRHPDMPSTLFKDIWTRIKDGKAWEGEIKNKKKDGSHYWVDTSIMPSFDDKNNIVGYTSIRHDITSQKAKDEFMANMSHELRTPLNAIIGFSGILNKKQTNIQHKELSEKIHTSSTSLLALINDILDLSKIKDAKFTIEPYNFNAYDEIIEFSYQFEGLTAKKDLKFLNNISQNLKNTFYGDWQRISQIMLNLISNAIKFTSKNGAIIFNVDYLNGSIIIQVIDSGIGMDKETQDRIFLPFEQADGTTTRKYGGTGLGLSITQSLTELMHGKIELESQEGKGSTFTVTIPLDLIEDNTKLLKEDDADLEPQKTPLQAHILVAEDNKTNQVLITMLLEEFGITCDIANDGAIAIEMYNPKLHKLILMDENMPNMNGIEAMKVLKEKYKDRCTPIIALTANAMEGDKEKFISLGMDGYISKPINETILYTTLQEFLKS